jgi:peptide/nickel transport system substrate-binding protein
MIRYMRIVASVLGVLTGLAVGNSALAQKYGGTLRIYSPDSPATMSILEEATSFAVGPMMGVFNNLVLFDQSVKQASLQSIVPDLATSWAWGDKLVRNPDYWKPGRPYLDGIEYTILKSTATAVLGFASGSFDMMFPYWVTIPVMKDLKRQAPSAMCEIVPGTINRHLLINRSIAPFDNRDVRLAMALALDRQAFIDIIGDGQGDIGGVLQPPPAGLGMPNELLKQLPGYGGDVKQNRQQGRALMEKLGYGPSKRLKVKVTTRDLPVYRDPSVILIDQLKEVYVDGELEPVETAAYFPKVRRKDYTVSLNLQTSGGIDPDGVFDLFYGCGSSLN